MSDGNPFIPSPLMGEIERLRRWLNDAQQKIADRDAIIRSLEKDVEEYKEKNMSLMKENMDLSLKCMEVIALVKSIPVPEVKPDE